MAAIWEQLQAAHDEVMSQLPIGQIWGAWEKSAVTTQLYAFVSAVDWSEPFFLGLAALHAAILGGLVILARRASSEIVMVYFFFVVTAVFAAEYLNQWGSRHHAALFPRSNVNYFDEGGIFVSAVFSAPLLVVSFVAQLILFGRLASQLVKNKRAHLRQTAATRAVAATPPVDGGKKVKKQ